MSGESSQVLCTVRLVPSNNYFIRLPRSLTSLSVNISDVPVVQLLLSSNTDKSFYCTVMGGVADSSSEVVEVSPKVGLADQETVLVRRPPESVLGLGVSVVVAPENIEDWQILRLNEGKVERAVLEQVRVVQPGQRLKINIGHVSLILRVKTVSPDKHAVILQPLTEFHVDVPQQFIEQDARNYHQPQPPDMQEPQTSQHSSENTESRNVPPEGIVSKILRPLSYFFPGGNVPDTEDVSAERTSFRNQFLVEPFRGIFRVQSDHHSLQHPYIAYIPSRLCPPTQADGFIGQISLLPRPGSESKDEVKTTVIVFVKTFAGEEKSKLSTIYLSQTVIKWKGFSVTSQVLVESLQFKDQFVNNIVDDIVILTTSPQEDEVVSINHLTNVEELESNIFPVPSILESSEKLFVISQRKDEQFVYLRKNCKVKYKRTETLPLDLKYSSIDGSWYVHGREEPLSDLHRSSILECEKFLQGFSLRKRHSNLLVTGSSGTGKTTFLKQISSSLGRSSEAVASRYLNCVTLKGKRFDTVRAALEMGLEVLEYQAPGLFLLDNLDCLVGREEEERPDELSRSLASWLHSVLNNQTRYTNIAVLASAQSQDSLHDILQSSRGSITFRKQIDLQVPSGEEIQNLVRLYTGDSALTLSREFLSLAEGLYPLDMRLVVERAVTEFDEITADRLTDIIKQFKPVSKWGQDLSPPSRRSIEDVGSLDRAKDLLVQTLLWPSKYPKLYSDCGVRTPRGILLYGAPGTGKTLLAEAVSSHTGLNFIPVRGPELLSKYIGASEANVRDLFSRAQSARPCIIFFDELESLAPRRGQDTTGVTDRVVNQLLTQLDGVEGLEGVWVIGASSRPDLIDPALLRPGRLDRTILCPLPDCEARRDILRVLLGKTGPVEDTELVLDTVAEMTDKMTGADLTGLVYTAQLVSRDRGGDSVTLQDFKTAVRQSSPSVTDTELRKYQNIYSRFSKGQQYTEVKQQKVTLA